MSDNVNVTNKVSSGGISFAGLLGIVFIVLKLCGIIDWPWVWVLCPFWIGLAVLLTIVLIFAIIGIIYTMLKR